MNTETTPGQPKQACDLCEGTGVLEWVEPQNFDAETAVVRRTICPACAGVGERE